VTLPNTESANWYSEDRDVMVELYGTTLDSSALAGILDPFKWDGKTESLRGHLERMLGPMRVRAESTKAGGTTRMIELEVRREEGRVWSGNRSGPMSGGG